MKIKCLLPLIALVLTTLLIAGFSPEHNPEKEEVTEAIKNYFKAMQTSDKEKLSQIIHEDFRLINVHRGKLDNYSRTDMFSWIGGENEASYRIDQLDVTEGVAAAKITEDGGSVVWKDYINLVKLDGKWWIIDKVAYPVKK